jgi:hypothetical protein
MIKKNASYRVLFKLKGEIFYGLFFCSFLILSIIADYLFGQIGHSSSYGVFSLPIIGATIWISMYFYLLSVYYKILREESESPEGKKVKSYLFFLKTLHYVTIVMFAIFAILIMKNDANETILLIMYCLIGLLVVSMILLYFVYYLFSKWIIKILHLNVSGIYDFMFRPMFGINLHNEVANVFRKKNNS